jgi:hypothetical protein
MKASTNAKPEIATMTQSRRGREKVSGRVSE